MPCWISTDLVAHGALWRCRCGAGHRSQAAGSIRFDKDVFNRMAEAATFPGAVGTYQGADLLFDLNDGLFGVGLDHQARPVIDLYRRNLQRGYVNLLLSSFSSSDGPSEFRVALRFGSTDLRSKLDQAVKKVRDPQTRGHLNELRAAIGG